MQGLQCAVRLQPARAVLASTAVCKHVGSIPLQPTSQCSPCPDARSRAQLSQEQRLVLLMTQNKTTLTQNQTYPRVHNPGAGLQVRKSHQERRKRRKARGSQRAWKLKRMAVDAPEVQAQQAGRAKRVEDPRQGDMERFMEVGPCPDPALQPCVCRTLAVSRSRLRRKAWAQLEAREMWKGETWGPFYIQRPFFVAVAMLYVAHLAYETRHWGLQALH